MTRMPPNDQVKNYIGKPIPEKLYSQLVATHQRLQKNCGGGDLDAHRRVGRSLTGGGGNEYRGKSIW